ncbi:MAG TPA: CBS domain-containing protein [Xanthobacteraceae bacterium]|nr:CBS domain-containing protein [Xanthobacteraceae bacterium]
MKASEVMTRRVISIHPQATVVQAIKLMLKNRLSGLPVIDASGKLVGIITEGDFLHRREIGTELKRNAWLDAIFGPEQSAHDYVRAHGITVAELMTRQPITVDEDASLDRVVHLMERHHIKRLPVLRKGKVVVGIVSRANLMQALASIHRAASKASHTDQEIRKRIVTEIEKRDWAYGADVMVLVRDGVVDLCGTLSDASQRAALRTLVKEKSGVRKLYDHLQLKDGDVSVT